MKTKLCFLIIYVLALYVAMVHAQQPQETEYYSTLPDSSSYFARSMEESDRIMLEYFSCPHKNPAGLRCKIWRQNHLSTLLD